MRERPSGASTATRSDPFYFKKLRVDHVKLMWSNFEG